VLSAPAAAPAAIPTQPQGKPIAKLVILGIYADLAPGYYLTLIAIISLFALITIRRTAADTRVALSAKT